MRLIYSPAACSISPHIVLEEIGQPFIADRVLVRQGAAQTDAFLKVNPKGKVPVLVLDDGSVVTETPVILQFLATTYADRGLMPPSRMQGFETLQICEYFSNTVHNYALTRLFRPQYFCMHEEHWDDIRKEGEAILHEAFSLIAPRLENGPFLFDQFSIADASLFFFELHASRLQIAMPAAVRTHFDLLMQRPSVQSVMAREELDPADFLHNEDAYYG
jgi:glutathione S-transferase